MRILKNVKTVKYIQTNTFVYKEQYSKIYAYDKIVEHLTKNLNNKRKREQYRCQIALSTINKWLQEGKLIWEMNQK